MVIGTPDEEIMKKIISLRPNDSSSIVHVSGNEGDGKKLLEVIAGSDKVIYWN